MSFVDQQHEAALRLAKYIQALHSDDAKEWREAAQRMAQLFLRLDSYVRTGDPPTLWSNEATQGNCTE